jgi:hypothetical protein
MAAKNVAEFMSDGRKALAIIKSIVDCHSKGRDSALSAILLGLAHQRFDLVVMTRELAHA